MGSSEVVQLSIFEAITPKGARFDLWNPEFREHLQGLTGMTFDSGDHHGIDWWNRATEDDARNMRIRTAEDERNGVSLFSNTGALRDFSQVWRYQTRKIQLVWDAWVEGRRITMEKVWDILEREFKLAANEVEATCA